MAGQTDILRWFEDNFDPRYETIEIGSCKKTGSSVNISIADIFHKLVFSCPSHKTHTFNEVKLAKDVACIGRKKTTLRLLRHVLQQWWEADHALALIGDRNTDGNTLQRGSTSDSSIRRASEFLSPKFVPASEQLKMIPGNCEILSEDDQTSKDKGDDNEILVLGPREDKPDPKSARMPFIASFISFTYNLLRESISYLTFGKALLTFGHGMVEAVQNRDPVAFIGQLMGLSVFAPFRTGLKTYQEDAVLLLATYNLIDQIKDGKLSKQRTGAGPEAGKLIPKLDEDSEIITNEGQDFLERLRQAEEH